MTPWSLNLALVAALSLQTPVHVQAQEACTFVLGFADLPQMVGPDIVGDCLDEQHTLMSGDAQQVTSNGVLRYRAADGSTAFTDGERTWIIGPLGLQQRLNTERFAWERESNGTVTTVVGTGRPGFSGDGGPARQADLHKPMAIAIGPDGSLYIADSGNYRIRKVTPDGRISTIAGRDADQLSVCRNSGDGDNGPALQARIRPWATDLAPDGTLYIISCSRVRKISPAGIITTVAGTGAEFRSSGDGGLAKDADLLQPRDVKVGPDGSIYIAEALKVRRVALDGTISTVAGTGEAGFGGDGGPAVQAPVSPDNITFGPDGSLYSADSLNHRVRLVSPDGLIHSVAGNGTMGFSGDGGPATDAQVDKVGSFGVAAGSDGTLYIDDRTHVRSISNSGIIDTIAGAGVNQSASGTDSDVAEGGSALCAHFQTSGRPTLGPDGSLYVVQEGNHRVRRIWGAVAADGRNARPWREICPLSHEPDQLIYHTIVSGKGTLSEWELQVVPGSPVIPRVERPDLVSKVTDTWLPGAGANRIEIRFLPVMTGTHYNEVGLGGGGHYVSGGRGGGFALITGLERRADALVLYCAITEPWPERRGSSLRLLQSLEGLEDLTSMMTGHLARVIAVAGGYYPFDRPEREMMAFQQAISFAVP